MAGDFAAVIFVATGSTFGGGGVELEPPARRLHEPTPFGQILLDTNVILATILSCAPHEW